MLHEAVQSVLNQNYLAIEVIIVNDGSTDETPEMAERLARESPDKIRVIHKANSGAGPSREAGRLLARGEFIQYLDSDDLLCQAKFSKQVKALHEQPECGAAYGWIQLQKEDGNILPEPYKKSGIRRGTLFPWLLADRWWNTNCPLWRRSVCDAIGPWSDLRWSQDWEYDARAAALGVQLAYVPEYVTIQRQHSGVRQTTQADWLHPVRIRNRRDFLTLLLRHAESAGITGTDPHRMHFARWAFANARNAAKANCIQEAKDLMTVAKRAAENVEVSQKGFDLFLRCAGILGWKNAATLFGWLEKLKRPGSLTLKESFTAQGASE
jgi:glycosyltransferase involved in cell wall biosynthesis